MFWVRNVQAYPYKSMDTPWDWSVGEEFIACARAGSFFIEKK